MKKIILISLCLFLMLTLQSQPSHPELINTASPWTYWWWPGSAVDQKGITAQLEQFKISGLGGAHIIPIYGVKGYEHQFRPFLTKEWLEIFRFTCSEAKRLGLGIDLSTGTGWPFGGPGVSKINGAKQIIFNEFNANDTIKIKELLLNAGFLEVTIYAINNESIYRQINKTELERLLINPDKQKYLSITYEPTSQMVKRAAPGGEGLVADHFDPKAMSQYLSIFDSTLLYRSNNLQPRAMYNDSYEVYKANWTTAFFDAFRKQHQYDLKEIIYVVSPNYSDGLLKQNVTSDYRETLASLHYEGAATWVTWCANHKMASRYQAHGSPGNLLDLYALADIPETESFGSSTFDIPLVRSDPDFESKKFGRPHPLMMKFASSPAHLLGKKLIASESTTWLGNHFKVALSQIKPQIDELFTAGINHIFYHGTTYSPADEPFPGWLFYASTNYGSNSHFYNEFPLLNRYITNCQKLLQSSDPDNDILVYMPIYDFLADTKEPLLSLFSVHFAEKWFLNTPFGKLSEQLWKTGYGFDYISDLQISQLKVNPDKSVSVKKSSYQTIIIPKTTHMTAETLKNLFVLAQQGAKIIFDQQLPETLPGNGRSSFLKTFNAVKENLANSPSVFVGQTETALINLNIRKESLPASGLSFIRKRAGNSKYWLITNLSNKFCSDSISLSEPAKALEYYNPMTNERGFIDFKNENKGIRTKLYLPPGSSCFLISYINPQKSNYLNFRIPSDESISLLNWDVEFKNGSPEIPKTIFHPEQLTSWTSWPDSSLNWYNGYANYSTSFMLPDLWKMNRGVYLQIDDLRETAQITINGKDAGTIWSVPYQLFIPNSSLKFGIKNTITMKVRNLSANEARYLDTKGIKWKKFYDANIVDITYKPFDASKWSPVSSGIIGQVKITAIN